MTNIDITVHARSLPDGKIFTTVEHAPDEDPGEIFCHLVAAAVTQSQKYQMSETQQVWAMKMIAAACGFEAVTE